MNFQTHVGRLFCLFLVVGLLTSLLWAALPRTARADEPPGDISAQETGADGAPGITTTLGIGPQTLTGGDPIFAGSGEFRQSWPLLSLGGFFDLNFTLQYAPGLQDKSPYNDGFIQFPPSLNNVAFSSNTIFRMVEFEDGNSTGSSDPAAYPVYVNIFMADDALVFKQNSAGNFEPVGPVKHQLKKAGDIYYLLDILSERVYIFRSRVFRWPDMGNQYIRRSGEAIYILDRHGNTLSFTYNADNKPIHIEDSLGRHLDFTYLTAASPNDRHLLSVTDSYGRTISFTYQSLASFSCNLNMSTVLTAFTDPLNHTTTFDYFNPGVTHWCNLLKEVNQPLGNSHINQTWAKNTANENRYAVQTQQDAYGRQTNLSFSAPTSDTMLTTFTQPDGSQRTYNHRQQRYPLSLTDEAGHTAALTYNSAD